MSKDMVRHRYRAPRGHREVLAVPPLAEVGRLLEENPRRLARSRPCPDAPPPLWPGASWDELRHQARAAAVEAACAYLRQAGEPLPPLRPGPLLLAGHQPELFHPGVWVKNFALHGLARTHGGLALNLVVDNDTLKSAALPVPCLAGRPHRVAVAFDAWTGETPYEERPVLDESLFATFPERVSALSGDWGFTPLLSSLWHTAGWHTGGWHTARPPTLGERFAAARRALERSWGCHNLELPVSRLCQTEPFARFACHLVTELPRLHRVYNACVRRYRRENGIRSRNHPVPDLAEDGAWLELPFWAWQPGQQRRDRLQARRTASGYALRAGTVPWPELPADPEALVRAWRDLEGRGLKVRSRALTTTLYARWFLGDLFLHGIGGGKYDELTDAIARGFYQAQAPGYVVLSATFLLPFATPAPDPQRCRDLARLVRDLTWNPQRHLPACHPPVAHGQVAHGPLAELAERKRLLSAAEPEGREARRAWFRDLRAVTESLRAAAADHLAAAAAQHRRCVEGLQAAAVLFRRDYPFCLYPEAPLREFCTAFV